MAISNRLVVTRRNTLTACLCAAIATTAGSGAFAKALPHAPNATVAGRQASRAPSNPFSAFGVKTAPSAHVTSGNVALVSNCADDGGPDTLRSAIAAASDGDTIDMTGLTCSTITLEHGSLVSSVSNLTLKGPGADALTIDGNNGDLVVTGASLDIQGVTIAHGVNLSGFGGCVLTTGDLSLTDVHISACIAANGAADAVGGGAAVLGNLTMHSSTVSSSKANAYANAKGGGVAVGGTSTLYDSTISNSIAEASQGFAYGGGLYGVGAIALHASTIDGNSAYSPSDVAYGGGVHSSLANISVLDGSTVTNNSASSIDSWSYGGGINSGIIANPPSATVIISHSTLSGNTASSYCSSCFVTGGGVQAQDTIMAEYSTISGNMATCGDTTSACSAMGGGLSSIGQQQTSSISLWNATISTNHSIGAMTPAVGIGGGIVLKGNARLVAHNTTIAFNHASVSGGGISGSSPPNLSELISTIVANNDTDTGPSDIGIAFGNGLTFGGSNDLVVAADPAVTLPNDTKNVDPHLLPLTTDDGGSTAIHPLAVGSPAIDTGANPDSLGCDQRGVPYHRVWGASADIGAYEYQGEPHLFSDGFDGASTLCLFAP